MAETPCYLCGEFHTFPYCDVDLATEAAGEEDDWGPCGVAPIWPSDIPEEERDDPGDASLRQMAAEWERDNNHRGFRRMARRGELEEFLAVKVRATRSMAEYLIGIGENPSHAWRGAIRVHICESEPD